MKLQQANHLLRLAGVVNCVVGRQPELSQPHVQKKNGEKASEIEDVLFNRDGPAERRSMDTQGCAMVGILEEPLGEDEIEYATQRDKNGEGPTECAPRDVQFLPRYEPDADDSAWDDEEQQAKRVPMRC